MTNDPTKYRTHLPNVEGDVGCALTLTLSNRDGNAGEIVVNGTTQDDISHSMTLLALVKSAIRNGDTRARTDGALMIGDNRIGQITMNRWSHNPPEQSPP